MQTQLLNVALQVIAGSSRIRPADDALRKEFAARRNATQSEKAQVSAAVFAYYRWRGWLKPGPVTPIVLRQAIALADRFRKEPESFSDEEIATRALPMWLGREFSLTAPRLRGFQSEPSLWLRARPGDGSALARSLGHCRPQGQGALSESLEYLGREDLFSTPAFHTGRFELQDLSSQAVGLVCAPKSSETWWDVCAGEGGKTLHLSDLMGNRGLIWASDRVAWRLQRLKRRAARARVFNYRAVNWNGGPGLPTKTKFDGVLVDAPCSGVGTWQRNPHARWTTTEDDVKELAALQNDLLAATAKAVKPGGKLVYAVCTLTQSETEEVAKSFDKGFPDFERLSLVNPLSPERAGEWHLQIWPSDFGSNGMFIAAWRRRPVQPA